MPLIPYRVLNAVGSDQADEWMRLGTQAQMEGKLPDAQAKYNQALRLDPRHALVTNNLAIVFAQSNLLNEALLTIERAGMFDGVHAAIDVNWSQMAYDAGRIDVALDAADRALKKAPDDANAKLAKAFLMPIAGRADEAVKLYNEVLDIDPKNTVAATNASFVQTLTNATPADLLKQRQRWYEQNKFTGTIARHKNQKDTDEKCRTCRGEVKDCKVCGGGGIIKMRPLRVGYVSGDFKQHSASFIFANVLLHHTPDIETYFYSCMPVNPLTDVRTKAFMEVVGAKWDNVSDEQKPGAPPVEPKFKITKQGRWRDVSAMNDEDLDGLIRQDRIDILVDLAAHTAGSRLPIFCRKPAPIQVTAWGFAHGTGCPQIDYFLADPVAVPVEEREHFAEKIVDLPCIVTLEAPADYNLKGISKPPTQKNGYITFGSYARYEKMSDACLRTFTEILRRVPDAKMEFKDAAYLKPYAIRRIMQLMEGIEPERLLFSLGTNHPDHMLAHQQCDLALDPYPHGGGVVSLEQLYMGVPLLTLCGSQASGRSASSVLTAIGRTDWIARTEAEYIEKAVEWSGRVKELADARKTLRQELLDSPVVKGYHLAVEARYKEMWQTWVDS